MGHAIGIVLDLVSQRVYPTLTSVWIGRIDRPSGRKCIHIGPRYFCSPYVDLEIGNSHWERGCTWGQNIASSSTVGAKWEADVLAADRRIISAENTPLRCPKYSIGKYHFPDLFGRCLVLTLPLARASLDTYLGTYPLRK